jgi:hypothetical protein
MNIDIGLYYAVEKTTIIVKSHSHIRVFCTKKINQLLALP